MRELALNILDIAENSVKAGASLIVIEISAKNNLLTVKITDDGKGMDADTLAKAADPFTTSRTTRKVGLGIPLFKMAAENSGGKFEIKSEEGRGTVVNATFEIDNIDRAPLGDIAETTATLLSDEYDLLLFAQIDGKSFVFDTREVKAALGGVSVTQPEIIAAIRQMITENIIEIGGERL